MADDQPFMGSWFLRIDRFADVHMVAAQNKNESCGLACIKMVIFKVNKLRPGAAALQTEKTIEKRYRKLAGETVHDFDVYGSDPDIMVEVLNSFGIGNWAIEWPGLNDVGSKIAKYVGVDQMGLGFTGINAIKRGYPVILACYWKGGGGHAIVVDTVTSVPLLGTYATICDPWDADVHFEEIKNNAPFTYKPKAAIGVNLWGSVKGPPGGSGVVKAIIYCQKSPGFMG
ncbi:MAG: hypothetical protein SFX72_18130 [Isosphaeraceae bacterium]|nr:hypothetical protein [Isosphaeraceae bacterium]